jgi:hypothetical protein
MPGVYQPGLGTGTAQAAISWEVPAPANSGGDALFDPPELLVIKFEINPGVTRNY